MVPPLEAVPIGLVFVALVAVALWQRPPLTGRGRLFYILTGMPGMVSGGEWLLWNAALCGYGAPRPLGCRTSSWQQCSKKCSPGMGIC